MKIQPIILFLVVRYAIGHEISLGLIKSDLKKGAIFRIDKCFVKFLHYFDLVYKLYI